MAISSKQHGKENRKARTIALCTVVRNAEAVLPQFFDSVRDVADELCVVDLGSTDRSREIAREHGARVESLEWSDSTADARNASLRMATSDWILVLDPEEILHPGTKNELRNLAGSDRLMAALLNFVHYKELGRPHSWRLRFFRNDPARRYVGPRNEQLDPEIELEARDRNLRVLMAHVRVDDHGYEGGGWKELGLANGREAFEAAVDEDPDNAYLWFRYGDYLRRQGEAVAQETAFRRVVELIESAPVVSTPLSFWTEAFTLWAAARMKHDLGEAKALLDRAERLPHTAHFHFVRGEIDLRLRRFDEAILDFQTCRLTTGPDLIQEPSPGVMTWKTALGIAEAYVGHGHVNRAVDFLGREAERLPEFEALPLAQARILLEEARYPEAIACCTLALRMHSRSYALWRQCAELLLLAGIRDQAKTAAHHALVCASPEVRHEAEELWARCDSSRVA